MTVSFLDTFVSDQVVEGIPTGGTFTPSGLIGQLSAGVVWRLGWIEADLSDMGIAFSSRQKSTTGKYRYYFTNRSDADVAVEAVGNEYPPEMCWRLEMPRDSILNFSDPSVKDKFQDTISYDIPIKTPGSAKYRHEFHLFALPYAVQAVARVSGLLDHDVFNANELLMPAREGEPEKFTDEFQKEMIGSPDDKSASAMLEGTLGQRRVALWSALGEENGLAYVLEGDKFVAKSETLRSTLRVVHNAWKAPVYAEVVSFLDPRVDAIQKGTDDQKRNRIAAIVRIFASEADAKAAAKEQLDARAAKSDSGSAPATVESSTPPAKPALPGAWEGLEADFVASLKSYFESDATIGTIASEMTCTAPEVAVWKKYLATQG